MFTYSDTQAFDLLKKKIGPFWAQSAIDKIRKALWNGGGYGSIGNIRVNSDWPHSGSIAFTRVADGARMHLTISGDKWAIRQVAP